MAGRRREIAVTCQCFDTKVLYFDTRKKALWTTQGTQKEQARYRLGHRCEQHRSLTFKIIARSGKKHVCHSMCNVKESLGPGHTVPNFVVQEARVLPLERIQWTFGFQLSRQAHDSYQLPDLRDSQGEHPY